MPKQRSLLPPLTQTQRLGLLDSLLRTREQLNAARAAEKSRHASAQEKISGLETQFQSILRDLAQEALEDADELVKAKKKKDEEEEA